MMRFNVRRDEAGKAVLEQQSDIHVTTNGAIAMMLPTTAAGLEWMERSLDRKAWQWIGNVLTAEPKFIVGVVDLAMEDGLKVTGMTVREMTR